MYAYPDLSAVCDPPVLADDHQDILLNPAALFEVLSPETEIYDPSVQLRYYLTIDTLKDYVLLDQFTMRVERYTRVAAGTWTFRAYERPEEEVKLDSIGTVLSLAKIYDGFGWCPLARTKTRAPRSTYHPAR